MRPKPWRGLVTFSRSRLRVVKTAGNRPSGLETRWEATYQAHNITIRRNEFLRGFALEWDGREIARLTFSWIGLGELHGTADFDGKPLEIEVKLDWGDGVLTGIGTDGKCILKVGGQEVAVTHIR